MSAAEERGNLAQRLDVACDAFGPSVAVSDATECLSYRELALTTEAIATELTGREIGADEPVLVSVSNRCRDVAAFYGVWKAGGVVVPVHRNAAQTTLDDIAKRSGARMLLDGCPADKSAVLQIGMIGHAPPPARDMLAGAAWIVFTSGSTGTPKGVVHGHDRYLAKMEAINEVMQLPAVGQVVVPLQLIFVFGHWMTLTTLLRGGEVVLASPFRTDTFMELLAAKPVAAAVVPTMMRALRQVMERNDAGDFSGALVTGGEPLPAELGRYFRKRWPGVQIWDVYGLTETATSDFYVHPTDYDRAAGTIGTPAPGADFKIHDETGELLIRTPYLMRGYLDAPELTAQAISDGYFRTGDQARLGEDGFVRLTGRLKDLINRGGNKISPIEVEDIFLEHDGIEQALAAGVPDEMRGESLHLMIVPARGASLEVEALREWAAGRMERHKFPDAIHQVAALPVGKTGKTDRNEMRKLILEMLPD